MRDVMILTVLMMSGAAAHAEPPRVVTDIAPVEALVAQVMEGVGVPERLIQHGATPHEYRLRPSEAAALDQADIVFHASGGLAPGLVRSIEGLAGGAVIVDLGAVPDVVVYEVRDTALLEEHIDDPSQDHGEIDPHLWLDPQNGKTWVQAIADELTLADPDNAARYAQNAARAVTQIDSVAAQAKVLLDPVSGQNIVVFHDAYQYFEKRFNLSVLGAISLSDASSPSPARIAAIRDVMATQGVRCVFSEPQFNPGLIAAVLEGGDVQATVLDPLGSALTPGPRFYTDLILDMAQTIARCSARD